MKITSLLAFIVPWAFAQPEAEIVSKLRQSISLICEPDHPVFILYQLHLSALAESVLNCFLADSNDPLTVFTAVDQYSTTVPANSCPLLFIENVNVVNRLVAPLEHRKLVVTTTASFDRLATLFVNSSIFNTVYLVFDKSQYVCCVLLQSHYR